MLAALALVLIRSQLDFGRWADRWRLANYLPAMLGRGWVRRRASPPNPRDGLCRCATAWRCATWGTVARPSPPLAEFGGVEAPTNQSYAVAETFGDARGRQERGEAVFAATRAGPTRGTAWRG